MKKYLFYLLLSAAVCSLTAAETVWKGESLAQWKALRNVKSQYQNGLLKLSDIQRDPQVLGPEIKLDPRQYDCIAIVYRAENTPPNSGEVFFRHNAKERIGSQFWRIPALKADGQWHTLILGKNTLNDKKLWFDKGPVIQLRLDMTNAPGGTIEIREIKLFQQKKTVAPRAVSGLDEDPWPVLKPEFADFTYRKRDKNYFQAAMIKSPADNLQAKKPGTFYLRREFTLKKNPVRAYLQFCADDRASAFINGKIVKKNSNWRVPVWAEVTRFLVSGKNVLGFTYQNFRSAGGVLGELYAEFADGTFERINTDGNFLTSSAAVKNWNTAAGKCGNWQKVIVQKSPPHPPWRIFVEYRNFSSRQHLAAKKLLTSQPVAGKKIKYRLDLKGKMPALPFEADMTLTVNGQHLMTDTVTLTSENVKRTGRDTWRIEADYLLPEYINMDSRKVELHFRSGAFFCISGGPMSFVVPAKNPAFPRGYEKAPAARVVKKNGTPVFQLNGKPFFPLWGAVAQSRRPDRMPRHSGAPLNLVTIYVHDWYVAPGKINTAVFDRAAEEYRRSAPGAWFMWDLTIYPSQKWLDEHPDELSRDEQGRFVTYYGRKCFSFASKPALEDIKRTMVLALKYLENAPYANRIIGYRINSGYTIEWLGWEPGAGRILDFSPAAQKGFKNFAAKYYPQLKNPVIPSLASRLPGKDGKIFRDQEKNLNVIAYHDFHSTSIVDMIVPLMREARKIVGKNKLLGTFYGYTMTLHAKGNSQMRGHYSLKRLLDSKTVDFLMSPQAYSIRRPGDTALDMKPFRSIQENNIVSVIEDDTRTHMGPALQKDLSKITQTTQTLTKQQSLDIIRRNMGIALCRNMPAYTYALANDGMSFDFPEMADLLRMTGKAGAFALEKARRQAQIAYVVSEKTIKSMPVLQNHYTNQRKVVQYYRGNGHPLLMYLTPSLLSGNSFNFNLNTLSRLGAPADFLLAEDLADHPGNYRIYIFINQFQYDQKFFRAVEKLRQRPCTLVWVHGPGYFVDFKGATANMKRLTGVDFKENQVPSGMSVFTMVPGKGVTAWKKDAQGRILRGEKQTGKALTVFSSDDDLDMAFFRKLAAKSGVHLFSSTADPIEANGSFVTLHARFAGKKTIRLPYKTTVLDVFNKRIAAKNTDTFSFDAPLHSSWLFYYGNDAEALLKNLQKNK